HGDAGAVGHHRDVAIQLHIGEPDLPHLPLQLRGLADLGQVGVPEAGVVVDVKTAVGGDQPLTGDHQRVDLHQLRIIVAEHAVEPCQDVGELPGHGPAQAQPPGNAPGEVG